MPKINDLKEKPIKLNNFSESDKDPCSQDAIIEARRFVDRLVEDYYEEKRSGVARPKK